MGTRLIFEPDDMAADSPSQGPGTPSALRRIIYLLIGSCMQPSCVHCSTLAGMLADYDGARLRNAGAGAAQLYPCLLHGNQPLAHECDWTRFITENNGRVEIQTWHTGSSEIFATEVTREQAQEELAMWDLLGVR